MAWITLWACLMFIAHFCSVHSICRLTYAIQIREGTAAGGALLSPAKRRRDARESGITVDPLFGLSARTKPVGKKKGHMSVDVTTLAKYTKGNEGIASVRWTAQYGYELYAARNIAARTPITIYDGEYVGKLKSCECWPQTHLHGMHGTIVDGLREPAEGRGMASFCNHSADAKATLEAVGNFAVLWSKAAIAQGEAICIDYGAPLTVIATR
jgi:hypothetical protein